MTEPLHGCRAVAATSLALAASAGAVVVYGLVRMSGDCFAASFPSQGFFVALFAGAVACGLGAVALALLLRARTNARGRRACSTGAETMGILGMAVGALTLLPGILGLAIALSSWPLCVD